MGPHSTLHCIISLESWKVSGFAFTRLQYSFKCICPLFSVMNTLTWHLLSLMPHHSPTLPSSILTSHNHFLPQYSTYTPSSIPTLSLSFSPSLPTSTSTTRPRLLRILAIRLGCGGGGDGGEVPLPRRRISQTRRHRRLQRRPFLSHRSGADGHVRHYPPQGLRRRRATARVVDRRRRRGLLDRKGVADEISNLPSPIALMFSLYCFTI